LGASGKRSDEQGCNDPKTNPHPVPPSSDGA
jgi:hypothetical protein